MYSLHEQYLDLGSGFHVIELRDERGNRHLVQLAVGHDACPACGAVYPKNNLDDLNPAAAVQQVKESLNASQQQMLTYAGRHALTVR
jgi:hypothetical protein